MTVSFASVVVVVTVTVFGALVSIGTMVMPPPGADVVSLAPAVALLLLLPPAGAGCDGEPDAMAGSVSDEEADEVVSEEMGCDDEREADVGDPASNELEAVE